MSRSVDLATEVVGRDVQSLALVEAMSVAALDARVQVDEMATRASGSADEYGEEYGTYATAAFGSECDEVVDVELSDCGRVCDDSPSSDTDAAILVICGEESEPLGVALRVNRCEDRAGEVRAKLAQHSQDIMFESGVSGLDVLKNHDEIVACSGVRVNASDWATETNPLYGSARSVSSIFGWLFR